MSIAGAVTALGDTLFPAETLAEGIEQDLSPSAHFIVRLRVWHPVFAAGGWFVFILPGSTHSGSLMKTPPLNATGYGY